MVGYLFAGQGSQYIGMGKDLAESFPESKAIFDKADQVLGFSLSRLCFDGPAEELKKTQNCQPAILAVSIAAWEAFRSVTKPQFNGFMAGLSLGEYSALVAAEAISFSDAVYLVKRRGEFMEEEAKKYPGGMLSVIGLDLAAVKEICTKSNCEIANLNCPGQIVISGGKKEIEVAKKEAQGRGAKMAITLEVSGAFHSSFMKGASLRLAEELEKKTIKSPRLPVISNVTARPAKTPEEIKDNLIRQVSTSVLWEDTMRFILAQGVLKFFEFGPGRVLAGLMRRINSEARVVKIEKKEDILNAP